MKLGLFILFLALSGYSESHYEIIPFGEKGKFKMLYDRRQGPQNLLLGDKLHVVYNAETVPKKNIKKDEAIPLLISYDLSKKKFSNAIPLGTRGYRSWDHHYSPVMWMDNKGGVHVLHSCHRTIGVHLSTKIDDLPAWEKSSKMSDSISYPTIYNIFDNRQLMYFRHAEHRGAWTYAYSSDEGKSWQQAKDFVIDLNMGDDLSKKPLKHMDELSSYQSTALSKDGKSLHVVFSHYDDNKGKIPEKFYNPRYKTKNDLDIKFNLYYVKINLETQAVTNFSGERMQTPIDFKAANEKCKIWDTDHRGAGIPAQIILDDNDQPSFFHVLTEETPEVCNYYYVKHKDGVWHKNIITKANHEWNCGYIYKENGVLNAYLFTGARQSKNSFMDKHGGGKLEKWTSNDGIRWEKQHDVFAENSEYKNWRFNNIKPVVDGKSEPVKGMYIFYGWKENRSTAKSFIMIDQSSLELSQGK